jgi:pimeloyl-ACP methyl ester carboxylesterase
MTRLSQNMRVLHLDKRGTGMSDRITRSPDLETRMDDVRAVMDAAGVERAALLEWGGGGPPLALFFAASHPERTLAVCTDSAILERQDSGYRWGSDEEEQERNLAALIDTWGDEDRVEEFVNTGFGDVSGDAPRDGPLLLRWCAKFARRPPPGAARRSIGCGTRPMFGTCCTQCAPLPWCCSRLEPPSGGREHGAYLAERTPAAQLVSVPGTAVVVWIEEPEPLVGAIESFLSSVREEEAVLVRLTRPAMDSSGPSTGQLERCAAPARSCRR